MTIKEAIVKIVDKQDLSYEEAYSVMNEIMDGETSQIQNASFLAALTTKSTKAETIDEISGGAAAMRAMQLKWKHDMEVLDIVGTGGDGAHSFNISTTAALVLQLAGSGLLNTAIVLLHLRADRRLPGSPRSSDKSGPDQM